MERMDQQHPIVKTVGLSKKYGQKFALKDVDLRIDQGEIFGLIGRNGAGKTTLLKILSGIIYQTQGSFQLFDLGENQLPKDNRIGALIEAPGIYPDMTARDNVMLKATLLGIHDKRYVDELLALVELDKTGKKKARQFSLGMKQRLSLAMSLCGDPKLMFLDEPTNGMDPQGIVEMRRIILRLREEKGITFVISSHILDELARYATHFGIIHEGVLLEKVTSEELSRLEESGLEFTTKQADLAEQVLRTKLNISALERRDQATIFLPGEVIEPGDLNKAMFEAGVLLETISPQKKTLEEYFISKTGGGQRD